MAKPMERSLKVRQLEQSEINVFVDGDAVTPVLGGVDALSILSLTRLGVGQYRLILKYPANPSNAIPVFLKGFAMVAAGSVTVDAVAYDRITFTIRNAAGAAADNDAYLCIGLNGHRFLY